MAWTKTTKLSVRKGNEPEIPIEVRKAVLERAHAQPGTQFGICEDCGYETHLELHHNTYSRKWPGRRDWDEPIFGYETPEDLDALCRDCHHSKHIDPYGNFEADPETVAEEWSYYEHMMDKDD